MYIIYTEILGDNGVQRYYWGKTDDRDRANAIAQELGGEYPVFHCVCDRETAVAMGIENLH